MIQSLTGLTHIFILEVARLALEKNTHQNETFPSVYLKGPVQEHKSSIYTAAIQEVVNPPVNLHIFELDLTVKDKFKAGHCEDEARCIYELEKCAVDLKVWMDKN